MLFSYNKMTLNDVLEGNFLMYDEFMIYNLLGSESF